MQRFDISGLNIVNRSKPPESGRERPARGLLLDTCLRRLVVQLGRPAGVAGTQHYLGIHAYRFLLEVTTGLRSKVPGETNVFGQFKAALAEFKLHGERGEVAALTPLMERVVADTRAIRRDHLHDIGGASYGRLVRKLIRPEHEDRILFVGAGNLAQSMLPFFRNYRLGLWNRRSLSSDGVDVAPETRLFEQGQLHDAATWATHLILTTPPDPRNDGLWNNAMSARNARTIVHLGHRRGVDARWPGAFRYFDLDDVFALRETLDDVRSLKLERARAACRDAAVSLHITFNEKISALAASA
jgi:hypothetical protein